MTAHRMPPTLRRTFVERSSKCMRLAALEHEAGVSGPEARVGHAVHAITAAVGWATVLRGETQPRPTDAESVANRILSTLDEGWDLGQDQYDDVIALIRRWAPQASFSPGEKFERKYAARLEGETITGTIDRLVIDGERARIRDLKSGQGRPARGPTRQLEVYAWLVLENEPDVEVVEAREDWIRFGIPTDTFEFWRGHLDHVEAWLRTRVRLIRQAYAAPALPVKPGGWCAQCPAPTTCSYPEWVREQGAVRTVEDAERQFAALLVEEARVKHRKKLIREALEGLGERALALNGEEIGFAPKVGSTLDSRAAAAAGIDLDQFRRATLPSFGRRKAAR